MKRLKRTAPKNVFVATSYAGGMLLVLILGYRGGAVLDSYTGLSPLFTVLGLLLGVGLSLGVLFREVNRLKGKD